jgi:hypothetical protein
MVAAVACTAVFNAHIYRKSISPILTAATQWQQASHASLGVHCVDDRAAV